MFVRNKKNLFKSSTSLFISQLKSLTMFSTYLETICTENGALVMHRKNMKNTKNTFNAQIKIRNKKTFNAQFL